MPDQIATRWLPDRSGAQPPVPPGGPVTPMPRALWRGLLGHCPGCGKTPIFNGFLTVRGPCPVCATPLDQARADDAPPYFTILIAGHLLLPTMVLFDRLYSPRVWLEAAIWVPLAAAVTLGLLRPVKGATVALMLKLNMLKSPDEA